MSNKKERDKKRMYEKGVEARSIHLKEEGEKLGRS